MTRLRGLASAAAAALCMMSASPSQAAAFQVEFDPYIELYGFANFFVAEPCLAADGNYDTIAELAGLVLSGCYITLESARISTDGVGGPYTDYEAEFPLVLFSSLLIVNHQFAGLTTLIPIRLEPVGGDLESLASSTLQYGFFHDDCDATLAFKAPSASNPAGSVTFKGCDANGNQLDPLRGNVVSITRIPEPGTLALLFGAGVAGWWVRRRRVAA